MAEVKKYDHGIFQRPGDEGSASQEQGKTYKGFDDPAEGAPLGGSHEHVHRPGNEGASGLGNPDMSNSEYIMGCNNAPPAPMEGYLQGPEVRRTYVPPASGADPTPEMPGAK